MLFHALGDWGERGISITWVESSYCPPPEIREAVDRAWDEAKARLGEALFDGPMCRMERWRVSPRRLEITLSRTSYKQFLGTNLCHGDRAAGLGASALANPVGVSSALLSADGWLLMGRRNASVAYYPNRIHPFAGALEPRADLNVFDEVRRELKEELGMEAGELEAIHCTGIAEDESIHQPELIFRVESALSRDQIEAHLDQAEHEGVWAVQADRGVLERLLATPPEAFTPIAVASLLCWGRVQFGDRWFGNVFTAARAIPDSRQNR